MLLTRLVPPLTALLQGFEVRWSLAGVFAGSSSRSTTGTMLVGGLVGGALLQRVRVADLGLARRRTLASSAGSPSRSSRCSCSRG